MANRRLTILYGSETGTAKEVGERIWREGKRSVMFML
jgi:flavodoxin